jgi:hypothetical protein
MTGLRHRQFPLSDGAIHRITSSYANVCNVSISREEVVRVFGITKTWERNEGQVQVKLTGCMILSPFASKRLSTFPRQFCF